MNIRFNIDNTEDYYTVTKSDHYGFNLTKHTKTKSADAKKPYSTSTLFYATLPQVAEKITWLGLKGVTYKRQLILWWLFQNVLEKHWRNRMTEQKGCIMSTEDNYKICVGNCEQRCERLASAIEYGKLERDKILRQYEALVDGYHKADAELEMNVDVEDEETFNYYWRQAEKANMHMISFRAVHRITSAELKAFHGVKQAADVRDVIRILGSK